MIRLLVLVLALLLGNGTARQGFRDVLSRPASKAAEPNSMPFVNER